MEVNAYFKHLGSASTWMHFTLSTRHCWQASDFCFVELDCIVILGREKTATLINDADDFSRKV